VPTAATLITACCAFGICLAGTRRPLTALLLVVWLFGALLVSSAVMQSLLGMPLTLADLQFFFRDPFDDLKLFLNYPKLGFAFVGVLAGFPLLALLGLRLEPPRWPTRPVALGHWGTRPLLALACVAALAFGWRAAPEMAHAGDVDNRDAWGAFLAMRRQETADRWLERLNVFFENRDMLATLPPAREQSRFALPAPPPEAAAAVGTGAVAPQAAMGPRPDILMALEESTFDPWLIAACKAPACDSPMFQAPAYARRVLQGPLVVQTTGGGTWLTEFAFLSGLDWRSFGRGGAYAPVSLAPRLQHALPAYLRELGYHTVVVAPTGGDFLHARVAYRNYGFDEFYSADDLKLKGDWHAQHDGLVFERALAAVQAHPDPRPLFLYVLTIRNHGPHGDITGKLPARYAAVEKQLGLPLADYLERLDDSAREFDEVRRSWLGSPRPRVIGWFGDHQPEVAWDFLDTRADTRPERLARNAQDDEMRFLTWHQLSANFGEASSTSRDLAMASPYLMPELLQFAGLPLTAHEDAALEVAAACQLRLLGCANRPLVDDYLSFRIHELAAVR
jgi:phosphoglycerol transferase MdoB-like AlkP superfamily enzyme